MPEVRIALGKPCQTALPSRRFRNPDPATSALDTRGSSDSLVANASAMSRGLAPAGFARTIAALVAMSPCSGSRGGSTVTLAKSRPPGSAPSATIAFRLSITSARISEKRFMSHVLCSGRPLPPWRAASNVRLALPPWRGVLSSATLRSGGCHGFPWVCLWGQECAACRAVRYRRSGCLRGGCRTSSEG